MDRLADPFKRFLRIESASGAAILVSASVALFLGNSPWGFTFLELWHVPVGLAIGPAEFVRSGREWLNEGVMTLFFFLAALELKRELALGELRGVRVAALSIAAALGGLTLPAVLYLLLQHSQPGANGWGLVMATDTALVIAALTLFGSRIPSGLRAFMLSMAIIDDIASILVVAIGYGGDISWGWIAWAGLGLATVAGLSLAGVRSLPIYALIGIGVWLLIDASGIQPTLAGVVLGLLTPARRWIDSDRLYSILRQVVSHPGPAHSSAETANRDTLRMAEVAARESLAPVERIEIFLHPWVAFLVMPLFALGNAGFSLASADLDPSLVGAVVVALVVGKPVGILASCWLATFLGLAVRPKDLTWGWIAGGSLLAGIGFTMALFIADLSLHGDLITSAKMGIMGASIVSATVGIATLWWLSTRNDARNRV